MFLLRHVFGIAPETIRQASDLLRFLLRRHYGRHRLPPDLERHLVQVLQQDPVFAQWPLARIVPDREAFFPFLQERWPIFLDRPTSGSVALLDAAEDYGLAFPGPARIPFDHRDVRIYVDNLFLEGLLRPVAHPRGPEAAEPWGAGGHRDRPAGRSQAPARRVAEVHRGDDSERRDVTPGVARFRTTLGAGERARLRRRRGYVRRDRSGTVPQHPRSDRRGVCRLDPAALRDVAQSATVAAGDDPPDSPVARAASAGSRDGKVALVVMDGLVLDQWVVVHELLAQQRPELRFREESLFAWIPTLTMVSRQACFAGRPPLYLATGIDGTDREPSAWKRFWGDEGLSPVEAVYEKNLRDRADVGRVEELVSHPGVRAVGLVVDAVDRIMHGMTLGSAGMHNQVKLWTESRALAGLLDTLLDRGFAVFLTSDHGNVEVQGCGAPGEKSLAELRCPVRRAASSGSTGRSACAGLTPRPSGPCRDSPSRRFAHSSNDSSTDRWPAKVLTARGARR